MEDPYIEEFKRNSISFDKALKNLILFSRAQTRNEFEEMLKRKIDTVIEERRDSFIEGE